MTIRNLDEIRSLLERCTPEDRRELFLELRKYQKLHDLEDVLGVPAEVILESIHRAPELTLRMLRGVIADAAFAQFTIPSLAQFGWRNSTPSGNFAFDHRLEDETGFVSVQVKLQRSEQGKPVITNGRKFGKLPAGMYVVETQRTRTGLFKSDSGDTRRTRPYKFGDFDLLAVSLQPSTKDWHTFVYCVAAWLLPGKDPSEIATYQPVAMISNSDWTNDFNVAARWLRSKKKKMIGTEPA